MVTVGAVLEGDGLLFCQVAGVLKPVVVLVDPLEDLGATVLDV